MLHLFYARGGSYAPKDSEVRQPPELENRMARRPRPERASLMPRHAAPRHAMPALESVVLGSWGKTMRDAVGNKER